MTPTERESIVQSREPIDESIDRVLVGLLTETLEGETARFRLPSERDAEEAANEAAKTLRNDQEPGMFMLTTEPKL